jgi:nucleotide-binding universal stress UspA family protein
MVTQELIDEVNQSNLDRAQQLVEKLGKVATKAGVPFTPVVSTGHRPHERILAVAKQHKCDVIFMATHGRSGFSKLVMGSVTQKVLAHATLPILIYR